MTYTAPLLVKLLADREKKRSRSDLFRQGTFKIPYRAKVGSSPHPNLETIVSAGEPCGRWKASQQEDFGQLGDRRKELPLLGYIPASSIRGIVRAWVEKRKPTSKDEMETILGKQELNKEITPGKVEFFDAWPSDRTQLVLDVVNPQQEFQVFHSTKQQSNPQPLYTLGNGRKDLEVVIAIRGIPGKVTQEEIDKLWGWLEAAIGEMGVGGRTCAGYGRVLSPSQSQTPWFKTTNNAIQVLEFKLYSQGCYGINPPTKQNGWQGDLDLRTTHWRGWLRSWLLRFLLGVMERKNAEKTLAELMGAIEPDAKQGCVRLEVQGLQNYQKSQSRPTFYLWQGKLILSAPEDILEKIVLPVVKFAASVGGVGRGCRRPLHIFNMKLKNNVTEPATRGCFLKLTHHIPGQKGKKPLVLSLNDDWNEIYTEWQNSLVKVSKSNGKNWHDHIGLDCKPLDAEVFSQTTCAVYAVPGPKEDPIVFGEKSFEWKQNSSTYGKGVNLIYKDSYKRKPAIGGLAGKKEEKSHCSWASIRRVRVSGKPTECMEIVCLFLGGVDPERDPNHLRSQFLKELREIDGAIHLFGLE